MAPWWKWRRQRQEPSLEPPHDRPRSEEAAGSGRLMTAAASQGATPRSASPWLSGDWPYPRRLLRRNQSRRRYS